MKVTNDKKPVTYDWLYLLSRHSLIIVNETMVSIILNVLPHDRKKEMDTLRTKYKVTPIDIQQYSFKEGTGIEQVRHIIYDLRLAHTGSGNRMVILDDLDHASLPSQNALLKLLEEPPTKTILVVTCENLSAVIDTIISRCTLVKRIPHIRSLTNEKEMKILDDILGSSQSQRLIIASKDATNREQAITLLTTLTDTLYTRLHDSNRADHKMTADLLNRTQNALSFIEANVTPRAVVEVLLLGFPSLTAPS